MMQEQGETENFASIQSSAYDAWRIALRLRHPVIHPHLPLVSETGHAMRSAVLGYRIRNLYEPDSRVW